MNILLSAGGRGRGGGREGGRGRVEEEERRERKERGLCDAIRIICIAKVNCGSGAGVWR